MPLRLYTLNFLLLSACLSGMSLCALALDSPDSAHTETSSPAKEPTLLLKPGQPLVTGMQTEDVIATYDVSVARAQVAAYPDSPEASFVLAVALTRTSMVEEALHEVRKARKLAENKGGPAYFDHMIGEYEEMLKSYPDDNRVRYGLAWAYYMKAYVLTHYTKSATSNKNVANNIASTGTANVTNQKNWHETWVQSLAQTNQSDNANSSAVSNKNINTFQTSVHWADVPPAMVPQIKSYYESALRNLDELLAKEPNDMWARAYRAFLYADYTGDLTQSIDVWKTCLKLAPDNPAAYFFLGESYLQQGNLKECLHNISKAIALRGLPN